MACAITSTEAAIVVAEINAPTSEHWKICGIYLAEVEAGYVSTK